MLRVTNDVLPAAFMTGAKARASVWMVIGAKCLPYTVAGNTPVLRKLLTFLPITVRLVKLSSIAMLTTPLCVSTFACAATGQPRHEG